MEMMQNSYNFVNQFWEGKKGYIFLPRLTKDGGWIEGEPIFYSESTIDDVWEEIKKLQKSEDNVYFCPNVFTGKKRMNKYAKSTQWLWADTDNGFVDIPCKPTVLVQTSEKSYQSYWKLTRTLDNEEHNALNRIVNWSQEADRNGWGLTKVLRLVGTNNYKRDTSFEVKVSHSNDNIYTPEEMMKSALIHFDKEWVKNFGKGKFISAIEMFDVEWEEYENKYTI